MNNLGSYYFSKGDKMFRKPILGNVNPTKRWKEAIERAKLREQLEKDLDEFNEKNRHDKILGQKWGTRK